MIEGSINWRDKEPTEKQIAAIFNMAHAIDWSTSAPKTRGECCDYIQQLQIEIQSRLSTYGQFRPYVDYPDREEDYGDEYADMSIWADFSEMF